MSDYSIAHKPFPDSPDDLEILPCTVHDFCVTDGTVDSRLLVFSSIHDARYAVTKMLEKAQSEYLTFNVYERLFNHLYYPTSYYFRPVYSFGYKNGAVCYQSYPFPKGRE